MICFILILYKYSSEKAAPSQVVFIFMYSKSTTKYLTLHSLQLICKGPYQNATKILYHENYTLCYVSNVCLNRGIFYKDN